LIVSISEDKILYFLELLTISSFLLFAILLMNNIRPFIFKENIYISLMEGNGVGDDDIDFSIIGP
jgi:hypothetical protein